MALDFGKLNFSVSFNPTYAFPLDARSYFESYKAAEAAAATAEAAGSSNSVYYYGQTLVVVEKSKASLYVIQPNKELTPLAADDGSQITINANQFAFDEQGKLILKGADTAAKGSVASIDENGMLHWVAPIDAYTKTEVDSLIANAAHIKRKVVSSVEEIEEYMNSHADAEQYIYMVPTGLQLEADKYDEYMVISVDGEFVVEKVGSWEISLDDYAKSEDVTAALNKKVDKQEGYSLVPDTEIAKLLQIDVAAEPNFISSVSNDFAVNDGYLTLQNLPISKITDLETLLAGKVDAEEGYTLLSPTDREKLAKLEIQNGNLEISGTVNASSVIGLAEWLTANKNTIDGLSDKNFTESLYEKLNSVLLISEVEQEQLKVEEGKLSVVQLDMSKITGLEDALQAKAEQTYVETQIKTLEESLTSKLNNYVTKAKHDEDIAELWDALTWKEIK